MSYVGTAKRLEETRIEDTPRGIHHVAHLPYPASSGILAVSHKAKYARLRTLPSFAHCELQRTCRGPYQDSPAPFSLALFCREESKVSPFQAGSRFIASFNPPLSKIIHRFHDIAVGTCLPYDLNLAQLYAYRGFVSNLSKFNIEHRTA